MRIEGVQGQERRLTKPSRSQGISAREKNSAIIYMTKVTTKGSSEPDRPLPEPEITEAMIDAGERSLMSWWEESDFSTRRLVIAIYLAMRAAEKTE